jgi:hypothetical protein
MSEASMEEKCFNCGEAEAVAVTADDVWLCESCLLECPVEDTGENRQRLALVKGKALERVTEIGPCPACGTQTVKDDDGGTRCLKCAGLTSASQTPSGSVERRTIEEAKRDLLNTFVLQANCADLGLPDEIPAKINALIDAVQHSKEQP